MAERIFRVDDIGRNEARAEILRTAADQGHDIAFHVGRPVGCQAIIDDSIVKEILADVPFNGAHEIVRAYSRWFRHFQWPRYTQTP